MKILNFMWRTESHFSRGVTIHIHYFNYLIEEFLPRNSLWMFECFQINETELITLTIQSRYLYWLEEENVQEMTFFMARIFFDPLTLASNSGQTLYSLILYLCPLFNCKVIDCIDTLLLEEISEGRFFYSKSR